MKCWTRTSLASLLLGIFILSALLPNNLPSVRAQPSSSIGTIAPSMYPLLFGSSGNVEIDIPKPGIAVRIEIPRDFLQVGELTLQENDTHLITSNIRNDYYYYNLVDESRHWTYDWRGTNSTGEPHPSDGPCFKPTFSYYDPNAPYCLEIWNYLNYPVFRPPDPTVNYCALRNQSYVFNCFTPPKFVLLHGLSSPRLAGVYNFTLFVANRTNTLGYPDFVHAWNTTLFVPVSMAYNAGFIPGNICDGIGMVGTAVSCAGGRGNIRGKGIVYALRCPTANPCTLTTASIVARAYVDQSLCQLGNCGRFNLTGLAPGNSYLVEGSAGIDNGVAYSLTPLGYPNPTTVPVSPNSGASRIRLALRRAPLVCGSINYFDAGGINPIRSLTGQPYLLAAGFRSNPNFNLNITVEGTDPSGHVFRFQGVSNDTTSDSFILATGVGVKYVGTDPYGTEFAGLPAPEDVGSGGYTLSVQVWVSGYIQRMTETATLSQSPGALIPTCSNQQSVSPNPVVMRMGGLITGTLQFCNTFQGCSLESPHDAEASLPITSPITDALFGGNIVVEAFDSSGLLRGVTVINGTLPDGKTSYAYSTSLPFYITGFSEYYNHSLSGVWHTYAPEYGHDHGLPDGTYTIQVYVRGYELTSTTPTSISIMGGSDQTVTALMTRGGAFQVTIGSFDNRFGTRVIQAKFPWRFLNSSIPVRARVYFYTGGSTVGYVERVMQTGVPNGVDTYSFTVLFAGQNWSLREIWFYGLIPTHVTNNTYTISAYTLGYVSQFTGGTSLQNYLVGFAQGFLTMFVANEVDITVPIFSTPQSLSSISEYDHAIGQVLSGGLSGAEPDNLSADRKSIPILQFAIFGFGEMQLSNITECQTNVTPREKLPLCGQGHFFYVAPTGTQYFDYGLDIGNYTAAVPEFGFTHHFLQVLTLPAVDFTDLLLQVGVVLQAIQMATITQGPNSAVQGWIDSIDVVPLSWAQIQATNGTFSRSVPTFDGNYEGVGALFLRAGTYSVTFTDVQYQSQTVSFPVGWGSSPSLPPPQPLCPTGTTC